MVVVDPSISRLTSQHLQDVCARHARAKETIAIDFANMSDLVPDGCDLINSGQESRLRILYAAEASTRLLLNILGEQDSW